MSERRPPSGLFPGRGTPPAPDRLRVLVVQSPLPPQHAVSPDFHAGRFDVAFARDALTVVASASARETDVVVLDTPIFEVDVDALLLDLERHHGKAPVLVLGDPPPGRVSGYPFLVRHLLKPIDSERLRREIDAIVRDAAYQRSLPPPPTGGRGDAASDFLEWSQLALELSEEPGEGPESNATKASASAASTESRTPAGAATPHEATESAAKTTGQAARGAPAEAVDGGQADEPTVEAPPPVPAEAPPPEVDEATAQVGRLAPPPPETGPASREAGVSSAAPRRSSPPHPPRTLPHGMSVERTLTVGGLEAAGPPLAGRTAAIVGCRPDVAARVSLALRAAGLEVRIFDNDLADGLPGLRPSPPDLLVIEPHGAEDLSRTLRELRAEVRLWHRPVLLVAADAETVALLRRHAPGGPDAVVRADAGEAELVAKAGFLLAPAEQVRERMLREKVAAGEIGPVGVATLVHLAALARPEGRLVLRGEGRLAEIDLRGSEIIQARLTEPDGRSFEGFEALGLTLTLRNGRFSLRPPPAARPLTPLRLPVPQAVWEAADRLTGLLRRLTPDRLPRVRRLRLRDRTGPIRGLSSLELHARDRLQAGDAPRVLARAPGLDAERVALLVEKLALAGDVVDVEEDDDVAPAAAEAEEATVETIEATAAEELPAAASPGAEGAARLATAGKRTGRPRHARTAWLVPIVLLALGAAAVAVLYIAGRAGQARPEEPGRPRVVALAGDAGLVAAVSVAGAEKVEKPPAADSRAPSLRPDSAATAQADAPPGPEAENVPARAPDPAAAAPADAGAEEEMDAGRVPRPAVLSDATASLRAGPGATVPPPIEHPDATVAATPPPPRRDTGTVPQGGTEPDADRRGVVPVDRSGGTAGRTTGTPRGGPAVLVVPRPEGVATDLVVFVDGVRRGVAPLQIELAAGGHELRFEAAGRQSLSIVRLRPGERRTVVPRQLLRQSSGP